MASSRTAEYGPAFFPKGAHPFSKILGRRASGKALGLAPQLRIESIAERRLDERLRSPVGEGGTRREPRCQCGGFGCKRRRRDEPVDEPQLERAAGVEP